MTKNRIIYLVAAFLAVQYTILYNVYDSAIFIFLVAALPLLSGICLLITHNRVDVKMLPPLGVASKHKEIPITIELTNRFFLPVKNIYIVIHYDTGYQMNKSNGTAGTAGHRLMELRDLLIRKIGNLGGKQSAYKKDEIITGNKKIITASLDMKGTTKITTYISSDYSGIIQIGIKKIRIFDYMGIFSLQKRINQVLRVAVLPDIYPLDGAIKMTQGHEAGTSDIYSKYKPGDDPSEVFSLREYQEGDKIQRIHWKLSSKRDVYMVKEYSLPIDTGAVIYIDMSTHKKSRNKMGVYSALIESALSISYALINQEYVHYISYYNDAEEELKKLLIMSEEDVYTAMDVLMNIPVYEGCKAIEAAQILHSRERYQFNAYIGTSQDLRPILDFVQNTNTSNLHFIKVCDFNPSEIEESGRVKENLTINAIDIHNVESGLGAIEMG